MDKSTLRKQMRALRLQQSDPQAGASLAAHFWQVISAVQDKVIAIYIPDDGEIDCLPLAKELEQKGARLALPVCEQKDAPLIFSAYEMGAPLSTDEEGMKIPAKIAPVIPEILLVPMVAFTAQGGRLGRGGGYYDRTLATLTHTLTPTLTIGLAYEAQAAPTLPIDAHDYLMDYVLTQSKIYDCRKERA